MSQRHCSHCQLLLVAHVWVVGNRDYCGKTCICLAQKHRFDPRKQPCCESCRGPFVKGERSVRPRGKR